MKDEPLPKQPRADAKLKTLPPERQADIFDKLKTPIKQGGGFANTLKWLREDGFDTSLGALSEFKRWYAWTQQLANNASTVDQLMADFKTGKYTPEQLQEIGQAFFSKLAMDQMDPKGWFLTQQLGLKKQQLSLDSRRIALLEKKAAAYDRAQAALTQAKQSKGGITPETLKKIETELRLL